MTTEATRRARDDAASSSARAWPVLLSVAVLATMLVWAWLANAAVSPEPRPERVSVDPSPAPSRSVRVELPELSPLPDLIPREHSAGAAADSVTRASRR
ncbi:MAG: hypothetical protein M5U28_49360 [Sandaracinaceae bacterium]|nr:hypothetical protein [Sandaracinaceae bacterium]